MSGNRIAAGKHVRILKGVYAAGLPVYNQNIKASN